VNRNAPLVRRARLEGGATLKRSAPFLGCGPGWKTREAAAEAAGDGQEPFPCPNGACPKWHLPASAAPRPVLSPDAWTRPRRSRPETGFPRAVKLLARTRAGNGDPEEARCECCGKWLGRIGGEIQHRVARGYGGSRSPVINGICNAVLLCGNRYEGCHGKAEDRKPEMKDGGFYIPDGKGPGHDPRLVPLRVRGEDGTVLAERWLTADGQWTTQDPRGMVA
jgi:5-methylcytosine-specific restriction enzyme A